MDQGSSRVTRTGTQSSRDQSGKNSRRTAAAAWCQSPHVEVSGWLLLCEEEGFDVPPRGWRQMVCASDHPTLASRYRRPSTGVTRSGVCSGGLHLPFLPVQARGPRDPVLAYQATVGEMETMLTVTIDTVWDDEKACSERRTPGVLLPCDAYEWSWALFVRHDAISTTMNTALPEFSLPSILVVDMQ